MNLTMLVISRSLEQYLKILFDHVLKSGVNPALSRNGKQLMLLSPIA